jgi:S-adenosylmethionine-dependent methyltransferase
MRDDISDIVAFYDDEYDEDARLERHQLEFDLTWRYLTHYLPPAGAILEIGAATGRHTVALCQRGYTVTAVDLSATALARSQQRVAAERLDGHVRFVVADARDLSAVPSGPFDAVLLMGPLYHLVLEVDRREAVRQAVAHLAPRGLFMSAHISRLGLIGDLLKRTPEWIDQSAVVRSVLERGRDPEDRPRGGFRGYFAHAAEIRPLHEALGLHTLVLAGIEPAIGAYDASYNALEGMRRERWLDLLFAISTDATIIGASRHLLYIGRNDARRG